MTFWKSTLKIFMPKPVRMELRRGRDRQVVIGEIDQIGDYSCSLRKVDGEILTVDYDDILLLDEVRL